MNMLKLVESLDQVERKELFDILLKQFTDSSVAITDVKYCNDVSFEDCNIDSKLKMIRDYLKSLDTPFSIKFAALVDKYRVSGRYDNIDTGEFIIAFIKSFKNRIRVLVEENPNKNLLTEILGFNKSSFCQVGKDIHDYDDVVDMYEVIHKYDNTDGIIKEILCRPYIYKHNQDIVYRGELVI